MKIHNTESFILKATSIHNNKYVYDKVTWVSNKTKVTITCPKHGDFEQSPNNHLSGYGCQECAKQARSTSQACSNKEFVEKAIEIHGNAYTYDEVEYVNNKTKVGIKCPIHGKFYITPSNHVHKTHPQGCNLCGRVIAKKKRTSSIEKIVDKFISVHGDKYDYSKVNYTKFHSNVTIICPIHGKFVQTPAHHIGGTGCPGCAEYGFNFNKPAILYYLSINNGQAYKIGITNRSIEERFYISDLQQITTLLTIPFTLGKDAYKAEQKILSNYKQYKYNGEPLLSSGNTELFAIDIKEHIKETLQEDWASLHPIPIDATDTQTQEILQGLG